MNEKTPNAQTRAAKAEARAKARSQMPERVEAMTSIAKIWCGHCSHEITITNFTGTIDGGDLLLMGKCAECHSSDVARVLDGS